MIDYNNMILLSDLDGTLLNSQGIVSEKNREAIRHFVNQGGRFGVATGRNQMNTIGFIKDIPINIPCILYNGCALYDFNENTFMKLETLSHEKLVTYLKFCMNEVENVMIQVYGPEDNYIISPEHLADKAVVADHQPCSFASMEDIMGIQWVKILLSGDCDDLKVLEKGIGAHGLSSELHWMFSSDNYLELLPKGANKGSMLTYLRQEMGDSYQIYAVGDYNNDFEMIQSADVGIATQNGLQELKDIADEITVNNNENAIAHVIYNIIGKKPTI